MAFIAEHAGGMHKSRCTEEDVQNEIMLLNRNLRGIDVSRTLVYFDVIQKKDPYFFYSVETDDNHAVKSIFWIDGRSRRYYERFGDVISFDTTYATNKYCMPIAPFLGVNHHRQTFFFGCALVRDEGKLCFEWLFTTWMMTMNGEHPTTIITDQDPAMRAAIKKIYLDTIHRSCQWHVMRKAREHLGVLYGQITGFKDELFSCINGSLTAERFEDNWRAMVSKYKLESSSHLNLIFNNRNRWMLAYFGEFFFVHMTTSQHSESMIFLLKLWVDSHTSIYEFVVQLQKMKMLESIYVRECEQEFRTLNEEAVLWSPKSN